MIVTALSIAGSDPSGGAGIQADLKSFSANGAYGMCVLTSLPAQSTLGVRSVFVVPVDVVRDQLDTLLDDITPDATKIGMLATAELARAVGRYLPRLTSTVLDPVMVATSGDRLLDADAVDEVRRLCTMVDLITPNLPEAAVLLGRRPATSVDELVEQAVALRGLGVRRVLVKGGHLDRDATDVYVDEDGPVLLRGRRIDTANTHGTGCTLSSAIAALRPRCDSWPEAVRQAKEYLTAALAAADELRIGHGHGPVHHFHAYWPREGDRELH
ncbi:bifunctional hydroxymethylpyrimidine kinase/phosphomethylpyrimidine kinase [Propionibacterium australiense]|uniref:Hydroxymethylpyrimidine kinase/phosphomethylpyrimidine kinase n=1 Tax=Propionibacterium australiense TaxID=119981 RepID=A0A383S5Z9_9ACTN|nr:bifunctional hydroxymethylpyrimidine kinase/phosphomethylpyrimidine kinase [Propionibacterium australiense]RLP09020.1 bifunctional hydroxymethylpyrimidine kinase/phosphomethylpyrimidine kinase [Propionibacterium australiense]RLP09046.1 bifunctional hydroxymethylpyrimidine kinase/phosphomethylpyrimidine kinase [Propionibacterium australiense]SYZ33410.1 hydroxymethylpyrimidine kinase/phosphomethylpyrimidine kinase [Propionibacterium australiense]VEH91901.1 Hydroxymethylpyrimidine/phosphomethyl